ncbi:CDHypothetical protein2 small effector [Nesidiocoris tenuis]|uniref:CRIB domain-containing protein n=1 Tax=Nesidiocoris tenuis TaxID=355587 RepID=A0ABN7BC10_9HEMI|nr:CDHypothetical protein2 small effector [Nesidiocoris tenuis]
MSGTGDIWGQFLSCFNNQPEVERRRQTRRRRIDRTMIGYPTDFKHTAHVGSDDLRANHNLWPMENLMQSKGGYHAA